MTNAAVISELGMVNDLRQIAIISHNLANINTAGFKREQPVTGAFSSRFESVLSAAGALHPGNEVTMPELTTIVDNSQGMLKLTGNPLDIAIEGDGFFELDTAQGARYTRKGAFSLDVSGRLVTSDGHIVNGVNGDIRLLTSTPRIDKQGRVWEGENMVGQLAVVQFKDNAALQRDGGGLYVANDAGEMRSTINNGVRQGYLEASNVNVMHEMVRIVEITRHFETLQRVISGYDQMIGEAISTIAEF